MAPVAPFLQHPAVAIRIREAGEARIVPACGVEPGCETSVPGIDGCLVPDLTDVDPIFEQAAARGLKVGDDEIDVAKRSGGRAGQSAPDLDRATGARRRELHDAERG